MVFVSRNTRNRLVTSAAIIPHMIFLGMGTIGQRNDLLDFTSANSQIALVTDKRSARGLRAASHSCTVRFADSEIAEITLAASDYKQIRLGEKISVTHYDGLFHIPFYKRSDS